MYLRGNRDVYCAAGSAVRISCPYLFMILRGNRDVYCGPKINTPQASMLVHPCTCAGVSAGPRPLFLPCLESKQVEAQSRPFSLAWRDGAAVARLDVWQEPLALPGPPVWQQEPLALPGPPVWPQEPLPSFEINEGRLFERAGTPAAWEAGAAPAAPLFRGAAARRGSRPRLPFPRAAPSNATVP